MAKIKFRRDTAADWAQVNPVLAQGEPGFEHDTGRLKLGDGATAWNSLPYNNTSGLGEQITNTDGSNTYSVSVSTNGIVTMTTARGGIEFGAQPEPGAPQHLHIMRPAGQEGSSDLYFGDDYNYVKLPSSSYSQQGVEIGSSLNQGTVNTWRFDTDGNLLLPQTDMTASPAPRSWPGITFSDGTFQNTASTGGNGLTIITGAQIGNQIIINTTIDGTTPDLQNASSIDYIPTTTLEANNWIVTMDPSTYSRVRFANGSTFLINGWNTDAYPDTGNGTSGFLSLDTGGIFNTGAEVWPITVTSYDYVAGTTPGQGIDVGNGLVWKFDQDGILTVPGEIQSTSFNNLVLRSKDNINLYAGNAPGDDDEGGDINIYAGQGDPGNGGGDVQIRGGRGGDIDGQYDTGNAGGYVELRGGYSIGSITGGYVSLRGGASDQGRGGNIDITGGYGSDGVLKLDNVAITAISLDTPVRVTLAVDHNLEGGDAINLADILTTVQLNNTKYYVSVVDNNAVTLFQDRALTIPVSGTGMTAYNTPGVLTVTATSANAQSNNLFSQSIANAPTIGSVQVGWTVTGPGLNGTKTVTAIDPVDPVVITVDGSDGSVFSESQSYTFVEPSTTGLGTVYSSSHGGDINLQPGSTNNSAWGDIGRTLIRGETQIGNESGNIWKFGVDGTLTLPGNIVTLKSDATDGLFINVSTFPGYTAPFKFDGNGNSTSRATSVTDANGVRVGGLTGDGFGPILNATAGKEVWISTDGQYLWRFTADRNFMLPVGGDIVDSTGASQFISRAELKTLVASSTDFLDFQAKIAAL